LDWWLKAMGSNFLQLVSWESWLEWQERSSLRELAGACPAMVPIESPTRVSVFERACEPRVQQPFPADPRFRVREFAWIYLV
jgi:hypothetical protein